MNKVSVGLVLLAIATFLAVLMGGNFATDSVAVDPAAPWSEIIFGKPALFAHAIIALLACGALAHTLITKRVIQVPFQQTLVVCIALVASILLSTMLSNYRWPAMYTSLEWFTYLVAMGAAAALTGRHQGAQILLGSLVAGCAIVSLIGIQEYSQMRALDPNWRIFSTWMNPNALAGILLLGLFASFGLVATLQRVPALLSGIAGFVIGIGIVLTQSKGGFLALAVGLAALLLLILGWTWKQPNRLKPLVPIAIVVVAFVGFIGVLRATPTKSAAPAVLGRVAAAGDQADQSAGFRKQLWQGALVLMKQNVVGTGGGSYQFVSTKPGLSTATPVTHQSFLQVGVEFGVPSLIALIVLGLIWFKDMFRGASKLPPEQNIMRAGVVSAILTSCVHSFIDSDLSYYGNGLVFFILLGIGLQLCADGVTPEAIPRPPRIIGICCAILCPLILIWSGYIEAQQAMVRGAIAKRDIESAQKLVEGLQGSASSDGETWYLTGLLSSQPNDRIEAFKKACALTPWPKYYRALARAQAEVKQYSDAMDSLNRALMIDPNNMLALKQMMEIQIQASNIDGAIEAAKKLVGVESTPYFTIRAIPEDVPVETYPARVFLASRETDPKKQIDLLKPAVDGYRRYMFMTLPKVLAGSLPGESAETAGDTLNNGIVPTRDAYLMAAKKAGDSTAVSDAETFVGEVSEALGKLN